MRKFAAGIIISVFIITSLYYEPVRSSARYVAIMGSNSSDCSDASIPCLTIQYAINQALTEDTIYVAPGTYKEKLSITNKNLTLLGFFFDTSATSGGSATNTRPIIDGAVIVGGPDVVIVKGSVVNIRGFIITGGTGCGLKYMTSSSGTIKDNLIYGNSNNGICVDGSNPTIDSNTIIGNGWHGIQNNDAGTTIVNNIITGNGWSGIGNDWSEIIVTNNTITNNTYHGIHVANHSTLTVTNNIIVSNQQYGIYVNSGGTSTNTYNDVWNNGADNYSGTSAGIGSISADPDFASATDLHLQCTSPALDVGNNAAPAIPPFDKDGNPRIRNVTVDMGAYEAQCVKRPTNPPSIKPLARTNLTKARRLLSSADDLLAQAKMKGLDTGACENLMEEAKSVLEEAKVAMYNPIYANNLALKAMQKMQEAIDCLTSLLGGA
jgi:parallel beta-helix repeat protein